MMNETQEQRERQEASPAPQFHWLTRRRYISEYRMRATVYTLVCNACGEKVIGGAPMNGTGHRYFAAHAQTAATLHNATEHPERPEGKESR